MAFAAFALLIGVVPDARLLGRPLFSHPIACQTPLGQTHSTTYDGQGRLQSQIDPTGNAVTHLYDSIGRYFQFVDQDGNVTETNYDLHGRYHATQDPDGSRTTTNYDPYNRVGFVQDRGGNSTGYGYDDMHRLQLTVDAMSEMTAYGYDGRGNPAVTIDARGLITTSIFDPLNRVGRTIDPNGDTTVYDFDPADSFFTGGGTYSVTDLIDQGGVTDPAPEAVYQSGRTGSSCSYTFPSLTVGAAYRVRLHFCEPIWTTFGRRPMDVSINGTQVLSHFDPATAAGATFKAVAPEFTAIADGSGAITLAVSASSGAADPNLALNAIEILTPVTLVGVTSFTYDRNGSTIDVESPAGLFTTYAWDAASRLSSTLFPGGGRVTETYRFDDMRVAQSSGTEVRTFTWAEGEVLALRGSAPSSSAVAAYQIDCGSASSVSPYAADSHFSGGRTFSTSATFDLSGVTDPAPQAVYQTCRTGNSCSYALPGLTPGAFYQLRFHFDEPIWMAPGQRPMDVFINGVKVISGFDPATQAGGSFKAVVAEVIAQPHASGVLAISVVSSIGAIDPNLALCAIEVWSQPVAADFSELFTHRAGEGANLLRAVGTNSAGASLQRHYHLDALGSVQAITGSSQSVETTYRTDAWGNVLSGSAQDNPAVYLGGLGYWNEPSLGLDYVRARWLNPQTGSWLSVDPVTTEPRYQYATNIPTVRVDPSGRQSEYFPYTPEEAKQYATQILHFLNVVKPVGDAATGIYRGLKFLCEYVLGLGPNTRFYGDNAFETQQLKHSRAADEIRRQLRSRHYRFETPNIPVPDPRVREWNGINTFEAFTYSLSDFWNGTEWQIGGFEWKAKRSGNKIHIIIRNRADADSLFLHLWSSTRIGKFTIPKLIPGPGHFSRRKSLIRGMLGDIYQQFDWWEPIPPAYRLLPEYQDKSLEFGKSYTKPGEDYFSNEADRQFEQWQKFGKESSKPNGSPAPSRALHVRTQL